jgi:hypothetical protein
VLALRACGVLCNSTQQLQQPATQKLEFDREAGSEPLDHPPAGAASCTATISFCVGDRP